MSFDSLGTGDVILYRYLWKHEALAGETEGRKPRPTVVAFRVRQNLLWLFPITTKTPGASRLFTEVPATEKRRAGLDADVELWIVLDEINVEDAASSYYLEPDCELGKFSRAFMIKALDLFWRYKDQRSIGVTPRYD